MKKTIKTAVAMLLAIIMACGTMTAFAATPGDIEWVYWEDEEPLTYAYAGNLTVGADAVTIEAAEDNNYVYCTFEAEKDGYYKIYASEDNFDCIWFGIPKKVENDTYCGIKNYFNGGNWSEHYYYLEKGEYVLGIEFYYVYADEFKIEYLGDVTELSFSEHTFEDVILGYNISEYYDEEEDADYYLTSSDCIVKFSNGTDLPVDCVDVFIYTDEELASGTYEVEASIWAVPYREKVTLSVVDINDLITKVEVSNIENYTSLVEDYTGNYYLEGDINQTVTVTYSDGTTETVDISDGWTYLEKYDVSVDYYYDYDEDWNYCFFVSIAGVDFVQEDCSIRRATVFENLTSYNVLNIERIERAFRWMSFYFEDIFRTDSIPEALGSIRYFFSESASDWLYTFAFIMQNTADLITYTF